MLAGPVHMLVLTDLEQQIELLGKERVVVLEPEAEQRKRIGERTAADDHLGPALRNEIERGEILEHPHRIGRAQDRHRTGETYAARSCRRGAENDGRSGVEEVLTMMFADSEDIESDLIGVFDLLEQVAQALRWTDRTAGVIVRRREAINADLHSWPPPFGLRDGGSPGFAYPGSAARLWRDWNESIFRSPPKDSELSSQSSAIEPSRIPGTA